MKRFELERHMMGFNMQDVADAIKVNVATVATWERGEKTIRPKNFKKLLDLGFDKKALISPTEEVKTDE